MLHHSPESANDGQPSIEDHSDPRGRIFPQKDSEETTGDPSTTPADLLAHSEADSSDAGPKETQRPVASPRLPEDDHFPATAYSLYSEFYRIGDLDQIRCHLMTVYLDSLIRFYLGCAGGERFPRIPQRIQCTPQSHAEEVVIEYFAKRTEQLYEKWQRHRRKNPGTPGCHLRKFLKQDFRFHCQEMLRDDDRYHGRAQDIETDQFAIDEETERELAKIEVENLLHIAIKRAQEISIQQARPANRAEHQANLEVLIESRLLQQMNYADFEHRLSCSRVDARQKLSRFRQLLQTVFQELLEEQGDHPKDYLQELS